MPDAPARPTPTTIVLAMIVKNEAHVLARCLASVKPLISAWVICDTGSTDGTPEVARRALEGIPGEVVHRPWKDFGHNRTEALELARDRGEYTLVVDADDVLEIAEGLALGPLTADVYSLVVRSGETSYRRRHLFKNARGWRYEGVLHEYPACDGAVRDELLDGVTYRIHQEGSSWADPQKYARDAAVFEAALRDEPNNRRYAFYLAQSYRDANMLPEALDAYERRAAMGGWDEEVFVARLEAAKLRERLGRPFAEVRDAYLAAYEARPTRAEPLHELARYCRTLRRFAVGYLAAKTAARLPPPDDSLFVCESVYAWKALDELAVAAYYVGDFDAGIAANERLLATPSVPETDRARIRDNLDWCVRGKRGAAPRAA